MQKKQVLIPLTLTFGLLLVTGILLTGIAMAAPSVDLQVCPAPGPGCDYTSIQQAVDDAADGSVIRVATGVYTGVQVRADVTQVVYIDKPITIRGGYSADFGDWDPMIHATIVDAEQMGRVIYAMGPGITVTLEGLHITGGKAKGHWGWHLYGERDCLLVLRETP